MKQNNKSRDKYKNKHKHKNKSNKNTHKIVTNFYGSHLIPITPIINYMKDNFETYLTHLKQAEVEDKNVIYLDDTFETTNIVKPTGKIYNLNTEINSNPNMPLDKLISYAFYIKTKDAFITKDEKPTTNNAFLETLKYQMGKDISRDDRTIQYYNSNYNKKDSDGKLDTEKYSKQVYNASSFSGLDNNYIVADNFYKLIIKYYANHVNKKINYNVINKIALLSCQNIFNFIDDLVTEKVNNMLAPKLNLAYQPQKNVVITFTEKEQTIEFSFDTKLLISTNVITNNFPNGREEILGEPPYGHLSYNLFVDLQNNTFKFNNFELSYEVDKWNGPEQNNDINNVADNVADNPAGNNMRLQYAAPVAVGIAGIVATPFILGALGGKRHGIRSRVRHGIRSRVRHGIRSKKNKKGYLLNV
jgi:hypothetical protein